MVLATETVQSPIVTAAIQYIVVPAIGLLAPLLIAALAKLVTYLHSKEKESKAAYVGSFFAESARSIVAELDVSLKPKLVEALKDGVLTEAEAQVLKTEAMKLLREKSPPFLLSQAEKVFGPSLEMWLGGLVERSVTDMKAVKASGANP